MRKENLRKERKQPTAIRKEFLDFYKKYQDSVLYCFFEGSEDLDYYTIRIETIVKVNPENMIAFICQGKSNVKDTYRLIEEYQEQFIKYKSAQKAYFIDRDFDPSIYEDKPELRSEIYETPCYSIENFYTSLTAFKRIILSKFKLSQADENWNNCLELYQKRQEEFHDEVELLNVWIACQRQRQTPLNLSNVDLFQYITIELDQITSNYTLTTLYENFNQAELVSEDEIRDKRKKLREMGRQKSFRGKFELDFLYKFLKKLIEEANKKQLSYFSEKIKVKDDIRDSNIIADFSQYADTPDRLDQYLRSFYKQIP